MTTFTDIQVKAAWDRYVETSINPDNSNLECMRAALSAAAADAQAIQYAGLTDQVILELRAAQHILGYPDALGDAIEAIAGVEEERVRLWNEVRDLKSSLNVEKAARGVLREQLNRQKSEAMKPTLAHKLMAAAIAASLLLGVTVAIIGALI